MRRARGLTLIEILLTLLVVALMLGALASLAGTYAESLRWSQQTDDTVQSLNTVLGLIAVEARSAYEIDAPAAGATSTTLTFCKIDNSKQSTRLPVPAPTPPATWNPYMNACQITYARSGNTLLRTVQVGSSPPVSSSIGDDVVAFAVAWDGAKRLDISLQTQAIATSAQTLTTSVFLPLP